MAAVDSHPRIIPGQSESLPRRAIREDGFQNMANVEEPAQVAHLPFGLKGGTIQSRLSKHPQWYLLGSLSGALLLCLCLALSGWLFPNSPAVSASSQGGVTQSSSMSPASETYWRNLDVTKIQKDLSGWSREDLARLFNTAQAQASDPATRQHLASLGKLLGLPGYGSSASLSSALMGQPGFVLAIFLSVAIWMVAVVLVVAPLLRKRAGPAEELLVLEENQLAAEAILEELLPDVALAAPETEEPKKEEEKEKEQSEPQAEDGEEELSSGLGDLASLFEEEDTSLSTLEQFCKGLAEISLDSLTTNARDLARQLRAGISGHTSQTQAQLEQGEPR